MMIISRFTLALSLPLFVATTSAAQQPPCLPFQPGERLEYHVHVDRMGATGHGAMWVAAAESVRGIGTWALHFETRAGVGPITGTDRTASWLDPVKMASLRFVKHERHILATHDDSVEIFPDEHRWRGADGSAGDVATDAPLDELSFIYFIRTLPFTDDSATAFVRHFEAARNPESVRLVGRETIRTKAGTFETLIVEMRVQDPRHYKGDGIIRINLTDDARRLPVRIESRLPTLGGTL
ncbi:MAG TPA: DUF3108 domain-containing protein, partial [Gemmatimonadaceae bacterium]|nr:DUF3108 domain-containing protein [Gemmatimonadaceae bacterium]